MADSYDMNDLFFFGDDFDAILDILESDEVLHTEFTSAVNEVQAREIVCDVCGKKYKTGGGLRRHISSKHNNNIGVEEKIFTQNILRDIVSAALAKVKDSKVFSMEIRDELEMYTYDCLDEASDEFMHLKTMYEEFVKKGDCEKFYRKYYSIVPLNSTKFFKGLSRHSATLLSTKVADYMIGHSKRQTQSNNAGESASVFKLSERETAGLQYIAGYVLHTLHKKHTKINTTESHMAMAILKAGKLEAADDCQKLTSVLNRGGLWLVGEPTQRFFSKTEEYIRQFTSKSGLTNINITDLVGKCIRDSDIIANYQLLLSMCEVIPDHPISKDVLQNMITLYVRVRLFSFAKDVIQHHKIRNQQTKTKGLRKELSRSCEEKKLERHE